MANSANQRRTASKRRRRSEKAAASRPTVVMAEPKEQVDLSVVEDPQDITSRELWIGEIHGKPIVADGSPTAAAL